MEYDGNTSIDTLIILLSTIKPKMLGAERTCRNGYHAFWDSLICHVLETVSVGFSRRYSASSSLTGLGRPHFCFLRQARCVFVSRRRKATGEMDVPLKRLHDKMIWRYDNAPYGFGYAAVGYRVSLVMLRKDPSKPRGAQADVIQEYDLSELHDRLWYLLALLNLSTLFRPMLGLIQPLGYPDYAFFRQASGVTVSIGENTMPKEYPTGSNAVVARAKRLYNAMAAHGVSNVIRMIKSSENAVLLEPIGERSVQPTTIKEVATAVRDVLKALVALHNVKIMHRDISLGQRTQAAGP